jgi:hypothetical protein
MPCPIQDCPSCTTVAPTEREIGFAFWWLIDQLPQLWQHRPQQEIREAAVLLATIRAQVQAGMWGDG